MLGASSMHDASITTASDYIALWDIHRRLYVQNDSLTL